MANNKINTALFYLTILLFIAATTITVYSFIEVLFLLLITCVTYGNYVLSAIATIKLFLRRTLVLQQFYSTIKLSA